MLEQFGQVFPDPKLPDWGMFHHATTLFVSGDDEHDSIHEGKSPPPPSSTMTCVTVRISMAKCSKTHDHWHCIHEIQYAQVHITCGFHVCVSCLSHVCIIYRYDVRMRRCICKCVCDKCNIINAPWAKLKVNPMKRKHPSYPTETAWLEVDISRLGPDIFVSASSYLWGYQPWFPTAVTWTLDFIEAITSCSVKQRVPLLQDSRGNTWPSDLPSGQSTQATVEEARWISTGSWYCSDITSIHTLSHENLSHNLEIEESSGSLRLLPIKSYLYAYLFQIPVKPL